MSDDTQEPRTAGATEHGEQPVGHLGDDFEYHTGPVTLRGSRVPGTTTDQRLLDSRGPSDWLHTDPWRIVTNTSIGPKSDVIVLSQ